MTQVEFNTINFETAYQEGKISTNPEAIEVVEQEILGTKLLFALTPSRDIRQKRPFDDTELDCPLCIDALTTGYIGDVDESSFVLAYNRYPGMKQEVLLVKNTHEASFLTPDEIGQMIGFAEEQNVSVLYSNAVKSIPAHDHAACTELDLPIVQEENLFFVMPGVYLTNDYPASSIILKGNVEEKTQNTIEILHKLSEQSIDFNLIVSPNAVFIHPIKNRNPFGVKAVGPREAAGYVGTSDPDLFNELTTTNLGYRLLQEASFNPTELKDIFVNRGYNFEQFLEDTAGLTCSIRRIEKAEQVKVSHIVGTTRGGVALAAVLMQRLQLDSISFAGCRIEQTASGEDVIMWKTEVTSNISGEAVVLTTDLVRSGIILKAIIEQIKEKNPQVKRVILVGSHWFKGNEVVEPDAISHVYSIDEFTSYPWEVEKKEHIEEIEEPLVYNSMELFNQRTISLAKEIKDTLNTNDNYLLTDMVGFGTGGLMGVAILSQHLGIRNLFGYSKIDTHNSSIIEEVVSQLSKRNSPNVQLVVSIDRIGIDEEQDRQLESFVENLETAFSKRNPNKQLNTFIISFDTASILEERANKKKFPWE